MAGISSTASKSGRRSVDQEVNMVPFIDLLMVTVSFLLVTAVWTSLARIPASARMPAEKGAVVAKEDPPALRVKVRADGRVALQWQKGTKIEDLEEVDVDTMAKALERAFAAKGQTTTTAAVLAVPAAMPMSEVTRVMDAIQLPRLPSGANAYAITFSTS
jgi:biopolymer transport protein ExbD